VKEAARLRSSRVRRSQQRFLIEGAREIARALAAGVRCPEAFVCDELCTSAECRAAVQSLRTAGTEVLQATPEVYAKIAFGDREEGVIAVAQMNRHTLCDLRLPADPLVAVVERLEKPGNLGAILRSADAAGVDAVIVADPLTDLYNPNTIRASLGTVFRENVCEATSADALRWLRDNHLTIIAACPEAKTLYTDIDYRSGTAIVLGSEAAGLSDIWRNIEINSVRIPMHGLADSLNVSTTAAVLFYEALRQRSSR